MVNRLGIKQGYQVLSGLFSLIFLCHILSVASPTWASTEHDYPRIPFPQSYCTYHSHGTLTKHASSVQTWCREKGARLWDVSVRAIPGKGLGMVADRDVEAGDMVVSVVRRGIVLSSYYAKQHLEGIIPTADLSSLSILELLTAHLIHERFVLSDSSDWWEWLVAATPVIPSHSALFWDEPIIRGDGTLASDASSSSSIGMDMSIEDALCGIKSSWDELQRQQEIARDLVDKMSTVFGRAMQGGSPHPRGTALTGMVHWALHVIRSRAWAVARSTDHTGSDIEIVPCADFPNHQYDADDKRWFDMHENRLYTAQELRAGQEMTISYGPKSSWELALNHGYVPFNGTVFGTEFDHVTLLLQVDQNDYEKAIKTAFINSIGGNEGRIAFVLYRHNLTADYSESLWRAVHILASGSQLTPNQYLTQQFTVQFLHRAGSSTTTSSSSSSSVCPYSTIDSINGRLTTLQQTLSSQSCDDTITPKLQRERVALMYRAAHVQLVRSLIKHGETQRQEVQADGGNGGLDMPSIPEL